MDQYTDLMHPDSRVNQATRIIICYLHMGKLWDEEEFLATHCNPLPELMDFECQLVAIVVPITWMSIRRVFPKYRETANTKPI